MSGLYCSVYSSAFASAVANIGRVETTCLLIVIRSHAKNGCKLKAVDEKLKVHERECRFRDVQCPKCRGERRRPV